MLTILHIEYNLAAKIPWAFKTRDFGDKVTWTQTCHGMSKVPCCIGWGRDYHLPSFSASDLNALKLTVKSRPPLLCAMLRHEGFLWQPTFRIVAGRKASSFPKMYCLPTMM